jgi:hypothetical protein
VRRLLVRPRLVLVWLAWALVLGLLPGPAVAAPLPPATAASAEADTAALESRLVLAHLMALGVSPEEARARLSALSDAERHALAERLDEIGVGGSPAAILAVIIVVALLVVLTLELMGRRVISRP